MIGADNCRALRFTQQSKTLPLNPWTATVGKQGCEACIVKFSFDLGLDLTTSLWVFLALANEAVHVGVTYCPFVEHSGEWINEA